MSRVLQGQGVMGTVEKLKRHLASGGGGGGKYKMLFLKSDEAVKVRLLQDPDQFMVYFEHYDGEKKAFVPAIENDPLATHPNDRIKRASERFLVNVLNMDNGQVQLLKMNKELSNRFMMRFSKNGTLLDRHYEIMRTGSGLDTTYEIEAGQPTDLDLSQFKNKIIDMEEYLLEQVDNYYGTDHVAEYLKGKSNGKAEIPFTEAEEPVKPAKVEMTQAEKDAENPLLDDDEKELPWDVEKSAEESLAFVDGWAAAKAEGLPCVKGPDDLCQICSHDVEQCVVKQ